MKPKLFISITLLLIFIVGCTPDSRPTSFPSPNTDPPVMLTPTITNVPVISQTSVPTATSLTANWESSKSCVTEYPQQPEGNQLEGVLALRSLSSTVLSLNLSLLDLKDGSSRVIDTSNQSVWDVGISPDGHALAYLWFNNTTSKWELVLVDSVGSLQEVVWSSDQEFSFRGWLNDHQLVVSQSDYIVVDPYQDVQLSFSPSTFPEFNLYNSKFVFSFDPLLSEVIYKGGSNINVLDLSSNVIVARIKDGYDRASIARWRPFANEAAVVASIFPEQHKPGSGLPDEIFIVQKDGRVRQLTHLFDTFGLPFPIQSLSWSPDGNKIAFWFPDKDANSTLMVTDYATGNTANYCILNVAQDSFPISVSAPIWSPDGKYLMVENRYASDANKVLIIDLSKKVAFPIAENASPIGWMVEK